MSIKCFISNSTHLSVYDYNTANPVINNGIIKPPYGEFGVRGTIHEINHP